MADTTNPSDTTGTKYTIQMGFNIFNYGLYQLANNPGGEYTIPAADLKKDIIDNLSTIPKGAVQNDVGNGNFNPSYFLNYSGKKATDGTPILCASAYEGTFKKLLEDYIGVSINKVVRTPIQILTDLILDPTSITVSDHLENSSYPCYAMFPTGTVLPSEIDFYTITLKACPFQFTATYGPTSHLDTMYCGLSQIMNKEALDFFFPDVNTTYFSTSLGCVGDGRQFAIVTLDSDDLLKVETGITVTNEKGDSKVVDIYRTRENIPLGRMGMTARWNYTAVINPTPTNPADVTGSFTIENPIAIDGVSLSTSDLSVVDKGIVNNTNGTYRQYNVYFLDTERTLLSNKNPTYNRDMDWMNVNMPPLSSSASTVTINGGNYPLSLKPVSLQLLDINKSVTNMSFMKAIDTVTDDIPIKLKFYKSLIGTTDVNMHNANQIAAINPQNIDSLTAFGKYAWNTSVNNNTQRVYTGKDYTGISTSDDGTLLSTASDKKYNENILDSNSNVPLLAQDDLDVNGRCAKPEIRLYYDDQFFDIPKYGDISYKDYRIGRKINTYCFSGTLTIKSTSSIGDVAMKTNSMTVALDIPYSQQPLTTSIAPTKEIAIYQLVDSRFDIGTTIFPAISKPMSLRDICYYYKDVFKNASPLDINSCQTIDPKIQLIPLGTITGTLKGVFSSTDENNGNPATVIDGAFLARYEGTFNYSYGEVTLTYSFSGTRTRLLPAYLYTDTVLIPSNDGPLYTIEYVDKDDFSLITSDNSPTVISGDKSKNLFVNSDDDIFGTGYVVVNPIQYKLKEDSTWKLLDKDIYSIDISSCTLPLIIQVKCESTTLKLDDTVSTIYSKCPICGYEGLMAASSLRAMLPFGTVGTLIGLNTSSADPDEVAPIQARCCPKCSSVTLFVNGNGKVPVASLGSGVNDHLIGSKITVYGIEHLYCVLKIGSKISLPSQATAYLLNNNTIPVSVSIIWNVPSTFTTNAKTSLTVDGQISGDTYINGDIDAAGNILNKPLLDIIVTDKFPAVLTIMPIHDVIALNSTYKLPTSAISIQDDGSGNISQVPIILPDNCWDNGLVGFDTTVLGEQKVTGKVTINDIAYSLSLTITVINYTSSGAIPPTLKAITIDNTGLLLSLQFDKQMKAPASITGWAIATDKGIVSISNVRLKDDNSTIILISLGSAISKNSILNISYLPDSSQPIYMIQSQDGAYLGEIPSTVVDTSCISGNGIS